MKNFTKITYILLIIGALLFLGFYRDFIFKNINAFIDSHNHNTNYSLPSVLSFISHYSTKTLINIKWLLTLIFSILYLGISIFSIRIFFQNNSFVKITAASYLALILVSGLFILTGIVFKTSAEKMYEFARYLMGMAQSPLVLMILIPSFKLMERDSRTKNQA